MASPIVPWPGGKRRLLKHLRDGTLWFFDPPYWQTAGYGQSFGWEQYQALADAMQQLKGQAILTLNDHPDLEPLFKPFRR